MKCLTMALKANALAKAEETYVRKFGEEPPEYPEGAKWGGCDELARLLRSAVGRNAPLRRSENGTRLHGLRAEYAARFGVDPCGTMPWRGSGERGLQRHIALLESSLVENARRLVLETDDFDRFDDPFLDELVTEEFENVRLDAGGRPIPPEDVTGAGENE